MEPVIDVNSVLSAVLANLHNGSPVILCSGIVLLLVFAFRTYVMPKVQLGNGVLPWLSIMLGALVGFLSHLVGGTTAAEAANIVLISGPGASLFWDSVLKLIAKKE